MGLFDIFNGKPAQKAAQQQRGALQGFYDQGVGGIGQYTDKGIGALTNYGQAGEGYLQQGYGQGRADVNTGFDQARADYQSGLDAGNKSMAEAVAAWDPVGAAAGRYGEAVKLHMDSLGVNGPEAAAAARNSFQASPAYQFNLDEGTKNLVRARNARGQTGGNVDVDAMKYASGLASNEFGNWQRQLGAYAPLEAQTTRDYAAGRSGALTNQAQFSEAGGRGLASLDTNRAGALGDMAQRYGMSGADLMKAIGGAQANLYGGAASNLAGLTGKVMEPYAKTYGEEAAAQQQGSGNLWNFGLNALKALPGLGGLGNSFAPSWMGGGNSSGSTFNPNVSKAWV